MGRPKSRARGKARVRRVTAADLQSTPTPVVARRRLTPEAKANQTLERERMRKVRLRALLDADVKQVDIERTLAQRGVVVSHATVTAVIAGQFRNADVERVFCELTAADVAVMFPAAMAASNA